MNFAMIKAFAKKVVTFHNVAVIVMCMKPHI